MLSHGITSILFASNPYIYSLLYSFTVFFFNQSYLSVGDENLRGGTLPQLLKTLNYGTSQNVTDSLKLLRKYQPTGPFWVTELWAGWWVSLFSNYTYPNYLIDGLNEGRIIGEGNTTQFLRRTWSDRHQKYFRQMALLASTFFYFAIKS